VVLAGNENGTKSTNSHLISDLVYVTTRTHVGAVADGQIRSDGNHNPLLNLVHLPKNGWSQEEGIDWYEE
jgi:hypothetical protein